jgi:hypothetical protein
LIPARTQASSLSATSPHGALADGVEHGLSVGLGARDDAEDRGSRRLMLQRFRKLLCVSEGLRGLLPDWLAMDPPTALRTKRGAPQG